MQLLFDMKSVACGMNDNDLLSQVDNLLQRFSEDNDLRNKVDAVFDVHCKSGWTKQVKFVQSATYDQCPERFALPDLEQRLLDLMERIQKPDNGVVFVHKGIFAEALHLTRTQRDKFQKSLDHLTETGFLSCLYKPVATNHRCPGVYRVNPNVTRIGKASLSFCSSAINVPDFDDRFCQSYCGTVVLPDGIQISGGTLLKRLPA